MEKMHSHHRGFFIHHILHMLNANPDLGGLGSRELVEMCCFDDLYTSLATDSPAITSAWPGMDRQVHEEFNELCELLFDFFLDCPAHLVAARMGQMPKARRLEVVPAFMAKWKAAQMSREGALAPSLDW